MATNTITALSDQQIADYHENGYLIIRNVLSSDEADELRRIVQQQAQHNAHPASLKYPEPGKYTISGNKMAEPGLAAIAEHPTIVDAVESVLGRKAYLTAFVAYLRSPGNKGSGRHCDYKRWRPVGSSMNWLFAVIHLTDFDTEYGPLLVAPKSHKLIQVINEQAHIKDVTRPEPAQLASFIDPELKAGDVLLMHGHTWHKAPAGTSTEDRCGIFNKYCAIDAPPATGYYPYNQSALNALSDAGKRLIPVCFDKPITTTRLLIESPTNGESKYLVLHDDENDSWALPGGEGGEEERVGWDVGSRIGSLQELTKTQLGLDIPWVSYIEDVETEDGICRVYGFSDETFTPDSMTNGEWFTKDQLQNRLGESNDISRAVQTWHREDIIRGKGKATQQSKQQYE